MKKNLVVLKNIEIKVEGVVYDSERWSFIRSSNKLYKYVSGLPRTATIKELSEALKSSDGYYWVR